jgi:hypothetical protein
MLLEVARKGRRRRRRRRRRIHAYWRRHLREVHVAREL